MLVRVLKILNQSPPDSLLEIKKIKITATKLQVIHQMVSELSLGRIFTMMFSTYPKSTSIQTKKPVQLMYRSGLSLLKLIILALRVESQ